MEIERWDMVQCDGLGGGYGKVILSADGDLVYYAHHKKAMREVLRALELLLASSYHSAPRPIREAEEQARAMLEKYAALLKEESHG